MLNLDTHLLLHALAGSLRPGERKLLASDTWSICAIVLWEIAKLAELGRIDVDLDDTDLSRTLQRLHTWPLTWEICKESTRLDVNGDPADQIIGATSVVHRVPLVTRDRRLLRSTRIPVAGRP